MRKRVVNACIVGFVVALLSILGFYVRIGTTADSVVVLKTSGMTCGSCSSAINKALEKINGVVATEVDIESGLVMVGYDTHTVKPDALAAQVKSAGFTSTVDKILTTEQFKQLTGRNIGSKESSKSGCCGDKGNGGCGSNKKS